MGTKKYKRRAAVVVNCNYCGGPVAAAKGQTSPAWFCSWRCRIARNSEEAAETARVEEEGREVPSALEKLVTATAEAVATSVELQPCRVCGGRIERPSGRGRPPVYCSKGCREIGRAKRIT